MDETVRAAIVMGLRKQQLEDAKKERWALMARLNQDTPGFWMRAQGMSEDAIKLSSERVEAMREAAYDKATELLGITELERYMR